MAPEPWPVVEALRTSLGPARFQKLVHTPDRWGNCPRWSAVANPNTTDANGESPMDDALALRDDGIARLLQGKKPMKT